MTSRLTSLFTLLCIVSGGATYASGDAAKGENLFRACKACHQVGEGAKNRSGPILNGVIGRVAASAEGFTRYSKPMKAAGEDGLIWTAETLDGFLADPRGYMRGTKMTYRGMKDAGERADIIAYLATFSDGAADAAAGDPAVAPEILALEGDPAYGEYLSGECTTCHRADGTDQGIPGIVGWATDDFVTAMHAYRAKTREHPVMNMVTARLGDDEIAALAAYFGTLEN